VKPALLVIDLQKAYRQGSATASMDATVPTINRALALFRGKNLPVFWVQHLDADDRALPGLPGFDFIGGLDEKSVETHVRKTYNDGFHKTGLVGLLAEAGVDTVILTGFCAEHCVLATYWGAKNADLDPYLLLGSLASESEANIRHVEAVTATMSLEELERRLG